MDEDFNGVSEETSEDPKICSECEREFEGVGDKCPECEGEEILDLE